jgi:MIP family channel proteins
MKDFKACLAELFGTFALVLMSIGAIYHANHQQMDLVGIALAYGLATAGMVSATVAVSGGHLNPAVSFAAFLGGHIGFQQMLRYMAAQLGGATMAGFTCVAVFGAGVVNTATPDLGQDVSIGAGILVEAALSFLVVLAMFGSVMDSRGPKIGGLAVGLVVAAGVLSCHSLTGAAMNPARVFGPGLVSGHLTNHAVYWIGPMLGAALAGVIYGRLLIVPDEPPAAMKKK